MINIEDIYIWYDVKYLIPKNKCNIVTYSAFINTGCNSISIDKVTSYKADNLQEFDINRILCINALTSILKRKHYYDACYQSKLIVSVDAVDREDNIFAIKTIDQDEADNVSYDEFKYISIPVYSKDLDKCIKIAEGFRIKIEETTRYKVRACLRTLESNVLSILPLSLDYYLAHIQYTTDE